jgi:drug/metabolite transporter (DMT)-like permease
VAGIALVAREPDTEAQEGSRTLAIAWAAIAALGFAATFILGNRAAAMGGEAMVALAGRLVALAALGAYLIARSAALAPLRPYLGTLILMGILDAGALALVLSAAGFAHPELAAVAASLFGVVTILLAWSFSGERLAPLQWAGVALIFAAVAALGLE